GLEGQFDAVISSIAIHNVRFPDRIRGVYREVFPLVAPGGTFINLDHPASFGIAGQAGRHAQQMAQRQRTYEETGQWPSLESIATRGGRGVRPPGHGEAQPSEQDLERIRSHEPATLPNHLKWLLEAGFDDVDCFWRENR